MKKTNKGVTLLYRVFVYVALIALAISIIVPVAWVFMASLKRNSEFIGADVNPWALPKQLFFQNFQTAFINARMGEFFLSAGTCTSAHSCTAGSICQFQI